jgi:serine/threonine-protein kinase RsbW
VNAEGVITITIPAKAEYLVLCRLVLSGLSRTMEIEPDTLADLKLAVTEACSNAVRHAYENGDGTISVVYTFSDAGISLEIVDDGPGFEVPPAEPPEPSALSEDGMGLSIIRALVDELELGPRPNGRGSRVQFERRLP